MTKILTLVFVFAALAMNAADANYDPLKVDAAYKVPHIDLTAHDSARERDVPLRVYLPANTGPVPVVMFSHGLGGTRLGSAFFGEQWAARGYVAVFLQHEGSDDALWKGKPAAERERNMRGAINLKNFIARVEDVHFVLDQLTAWNADKTNALFGRLDLKKIGMSGHSFGAITTEAVSGETFPADSESINDSRITAAIAFSPSPPRTMSPDEAFGSVKIPWMLMTGTKDVSPMGLGGNSNAKTRLLVYPALHGAPKYELVLFNAEHSVFTERPLPGDREPRNPNHRRVILALTTAMWDAYLKNDSAALAWLNSNQPRAVMETNDTWQFSAH